jgi:hypothetical protein
MIIKIATRLRPFSHELGTHCLLPGSELHFQIFPALIRVFEKEQLLTEIALDVNGPLDNFTVQLDLEKGGIHVFAKGALDYFIRAADSKFVIESKKPLAWQGTQGKVIPWEKKPALSLGCHKAQDFTMIKRRMDLTEILPHWHRLGCGLIPSGKRPQGGTAALLDRAWHCDKTEVASLLTTLFQAGFSGILHPRLTDEEHQGLHLPAVTSGSPLYLLSEGAQLIEQLFIQEEGSQISLLPRLPPEFHCGRFIDLLLKTGKIHFEWSKKLLKKVIFSPNKNQTVDFHFQKALKKCRLCQGLRDRGQKLFLPFSLSAEAGTTYYLDRFEK